MKDMQEWLLTAYEEGEVTQADLRAALVNKSLARELWVEFCDSDNFVDGCQSQIEKFLEMIDDVSA